MIENYFKTAFRSLLRHKSYAIINMAGLSIGMAACLVLFLVIRYELSYDTFQPNYAAICNIATRDEYSDGTNFTPGIPYPALASIRTDLPQLTTGALFACSGTQVRVNGDQSHEKFLEETGVFFCDQQFFEIFRYNWLYGNEKVLSEPNQLVMTKSIADKYFGSWKNAPGKTVKLDNALDMQVSGILDDLPGNTDFPIRMVGSYITVVQNPVYGYSTDWGYTTGNFHLYTLVPPEKRAAVEAQLKGLANKYYKNKGGEVRYNFLRPLSDIHFDTVMGNMGTHITSRSVLLTLTLIGFLIIVMACINFINLSTAQAVTRSREVGVRKVLGGNRWQLFRQLLGETLFVVLAAAVAAVLIASVALPYIHHIISIDEKLSLFSLPALLFLAAVIVLVTLLSGIYPALVLSGFTPVTALKNKVSSASVGGISLRRGLVVVQFAISQLLIVGTLVAVSQMDFVQNADLGFDKEAVLQVYGGNDSISLGRQEAFRQQLMKIPGVQLVSFNSDAPSSGNNNSSNFAIDHRPDEKFNIDLKFGDENYFKAFGLRFVAGEAYQRNDSDNKVVVNQTLLKMLNIQPQEAIGKELRKGGGKWRKICGVVQDFKTNSLRDEVQPVMICSSPARQTAAAVKLHSSGLQQSVAAIQRVWNQLYPDYVYIGSFVDDDIDKFYEQEKQLTLLYKLFAALAIFISCLGLYGLISFITSQKTKEVGIRKVLGASVMQIIYLFSKEFSLLIVIAFAIAAPLAWYFMNGWLQNFAYHIPIGFGVFAVTILVSAGVAWITVGYKALRAAMANPVKSLRTE